MIDAAAFYAAIDGTWPAATITRAGPWTIRDGQGGGKRVSAATADEPTHDLAQAEHAMRHAHQTPLFMVRQGEDALDTLLDQNGYTIVDPTNGYITPVETLTDIPIPRVTAFAIWEPLAIMKDIWAAGGIGPARLAIMHRARTKTAILARHKDKPAGTAFVAIHDRIAMVHAVEVLAHQRRHGMAQWMMRRAALWAAENGATYMAVLTTAANGPANALYQGLGFGRACGYHYRIASEDT
ncbi:GNAT family N-acetyltransferase [Tateyamaria omphalii]|uniref:GNAT family N-acetyltransferase n=1 Tax=Tateyamaria omphalii TaxID=299262 RepID=A0A1P8MXK5_9RHOB|nr:GNAT family N-acetyltransferase [Tateyamaria omphalii]APX12820.1 GNAT family N-acetyltransferase [Tateyamaria omphalii]